MFAKPWFSKYLGYIGGGRVLWFHIGRLCLSAYHMSIHIFMLCVFLHIFSFLDDNLNKYQFILTKLGVCIDIMESSGLGFLIGKFLQSLIVIYSPQNGGHVLSFHLFIPCRTSKYKPSVFYFQDSIEVVRKFMNRDPDQLNFTLMALANVAWEDVDSECSATSKLLYGIINCSSLAVLDSLSRGLSSQHKRDCQIFFFLIFFSHFSQRSCLGGVFWISMG